MKTAAAAIYLFTAGLLLGAPALGAPSLQLRTAHAEVAERSSTGGRGCTPDGHYFVSSNGIATIFRCQGRCKLDSVGQPRCNNGVVSSVKKEADVVPFAVVPVP